MQLNCDRAIKEYENPTQPLKFIKKLSVTTSMGKSIN
jgi:hypothetical protein